VVDSARSYAVGSGFVVLVDAFGNEVARSLTNQAGEFSLRAPSAGQYTLRSERIGFRAFLSEPLDLVDGQILEYTLRVSALPVRLDAIIVPGRDRCNANPEQGANTVLIWEEIRKALAASVWGDEQQFFHYRQYTYRRDLNERRNRKLSETGISKSGLADPPFRSVPAEQLANDGYVVERPDGVWYYLPDAHTLLDEDFLDNHCFHVVRDQNHRPGQVGLAFEPMGERGLPDVEGAMWLDEASSELRELEVRHTRLRYDARDLRIGGTVRFMMLPSGAWIVREWQVRTPKLRVTEDPRSPRGHRAAVEGFTDTGGEIYEVSTRQGIEVYEAAVATIAGSVYDSTSAAYLKGAFVTVVGTDFRTLTDSAGRFDLSLPLDGEYSLALNHPWLDSVAAPDQVLRVELVRDTVTEVAFAVPHVRSSARRLCGRIADDPAYRTIFGFVRQAGSGAPTRDASVTAIWQAIDISGRDEGARLTVSNNSKTVASDDLGFFTICGIPAGAPVRLKAEKGGETSREASLLFPRELGGPVSLAWDKRPGEPYHHGVGAPEPVLRFDLTLGAGRQEEAALVSPVLRGVVTDSASGEPIGGVTVILNGSEHTTTAADGSYELATGLSRDTVNHVEFRRSSYVSRTVDLQIRTMDREIVLNMAIASTGLDLGNSTRPNWLEGEFHESL